MVLGVARSRLNSDSKLATNPLSKEELEIWHALKQLGTLGFAAVERDIEAAAQLSGADFGILSRLEDLGDGVLAQSALRESLQWDKSRLSHQLTRMESRGLLRRKVVGKDSNTTVSILAKGRQAIAAARPAHAAAVRDHVLRHVTAEDAKAILRVMRRLQSEKP